MICNFLEPAFQSLRSRKRQALVGAGFLLLSSMVASQDQVEEVERSKQVQPVVDAEGMVHAPAFDVPYSALASKESRQHFLDTVSWLQGMRNEPTLSADSDAERTLLLRRYLDEKVYTPGLARLRAAFPVEIKPERIGGVQTDVITPAQGVAKENAHRVLINLHGGGFAIGARLGGQMESIPIASLGAIRVVTVDYRMWPEHHFPAASEDVAQVYRELLKQYRPENIGIYGCSAGSVLTAQSMAWFQQHELPRPGAIGLFGAGALLVPGDSNYTSAILAGLPATTKARTGYLDVPGLDPKSPLVAPAYSADVLAQFPPALLISGTRDPWMSGVIFTHTQLINAGVDARLHIWEAAPHCAFAQPIIDPQQPESREAWSVIIKFFDARLGSKPKRET